MDIVAKFIGITLGLLARWFAQGFITALGALWAFEFLYHNLGK